ncbi:hypothetical protein ABVK25_002474 [Lepraria finkii]|uniref:Uncharacterized protein n=1 Tax=Lepraria finkii TaxID=1340010 RepID=A0ABR4BKQ8_9LECA
MYIPPLKNHLPTFRQNPTSTFVANTLITLFPNTKNSRHSDYIDLKLSMGCTPSKPAPTAVSRPQISLLIHPNSRPIHSSTPAPARQTLYQNPNYTPRTPAEKARMNAKRLPLLPPKAELRAKGQLDSHGKIIMVNQSRGQTLPHPPKPAQNTMASPAIQKQNYSRKPVPVPVKISNPKPVQVPRESKRVPANHG